MSSKIAIGAPYLLALTSLPAPAADALKRTVSDRIARTFAAPCVLATLLTLAAGSHTEVAAADPIAGSPVAGAPVASADCDRRQPDADVLARLVPITLRDVVACRGPAWLESLAAEQGGDVMVERASALVESVGASIDDFAVASGRHRAGKPKNGPRVTAVRVEGSEAQQFVAPAVQLVLGVEWPSTPVERTVGVRTVTKFRDTATRSDKPVWVYAPRGDTLWFVQTGRQRQLGNIIAGLPSPGESIEVPEFGVAVTFPAHWTVDIIREWSGSTDQAGPDAKAWDVVRAEAPRDPRRDFGLGCNVRVYRATDVSAHGLLARFEDQWVDGAPAPIEGLDDGIVRSAGRMRFFGVVLDVELYARDSDDRIAMLWCGGEELPSAELGEIAATLQLFPAARG